MGDTSFAHLSVHAGTDARAACASYLYDPPILSVHAGGYAAECARIHAARAHRAAPVPCDCAEGEAAASASAGEPA